MASSNVYFTNVFTSVKPVKSNGIEADVAHRQVAPVAAPSAIVPVVGTIFERKPWLLDTVPDPESVPSDFEITWADLTPKHK